MKFKAGRRIDVGVEIHGGTEGAIMVDSQYRLKQIGKLYGQRQNVYHINHVLVNLLSPVVTLCQIQTAK